MSNSYLASYEELAGDNDHGLSSIDGATSKKSNALSNKLTTVLSSSYTNPELRDALRLLDIQGAQNAEEKRWNLKHDAQQQVIAANGRIIDDFENVARQLKRVGTLIASLNQTCDQMRSHILLSKQETAPMLEEATTLLIRKDDTDVKHHLLNAFGEHFLISDQDLNTLTNSVQPVNDDFFVVLSRVKQIHKDCELLLGHENQRLGLEMMEQTTRNLDAGYKKLYNWIQREFKGLDLEDPHISGSIRRSLRALSERPSLFQNCLDFFAEARQATLAEAFQKALTESTFGASKAIEFSTHDPLRYIGDMLAWIHSTAISEMEALEGLFISDADEVTQGLTRGKTVEPWTRLKQGFSSEGTGRIETNDEEDSKSFDGRSALTLLISRNLSSVCQNLYQRVSLTVRNLNDPVEIYKAYNLEAFYYDMFLKLIKPTKDSKQQEMALLSTMTTLQSSTLSHFENTTAGDFKKNMDDEISPDLSPPGYLQQTLSQLDAIVRTRGPNLKSKEFIRLYQIMLTPLLNHCAETVMVMQESEKEDHQISTIWNMNYLTLVRNSLQSMVKLTPLAEDPVTHAENEISSLQASLKSAMLTHLLNISGVKVLSDRLEAAAKISNSSYAQRWTFVHDKEGIGLEDLAQQLDNFLAHAFMDSQEDLSRLEDKQAAKSILINVVGVFCEKFDTIVRQLDDLDRRSQEERSRKLSDADQGSGLDAPGVMQESNGISARALYPRTTAEVEALLS